MSEFSIEILEETDSTNEYLKRHPEKPAWSAVLAKKQTAGKGRLGRSFHSAEGLGMYLSMVLEAEGILDRLTPAAAVAARRVVQSLGVDCGIKWVNDIIVERGGIWRKLCGILVELRGNRAILGIGIDLKQTEADFPEELKDICTSVAIEGGRACEPVEAAELFLGELKHVLQDEEAAFAEYCENCVTVGKDVFVKRTTEDAGVPAKALRVNRDYSLEVVYPEGRRENVWMGEVSVKW